MVLWSSALSLGGVFVLGAARLGEHHHCSGAGSLASILFKWHRDFDHCHCART